MKIGQKLIKFLWKLVMEASLNTSLAIKILKTNKKFETLFRRKNRKTLEFSFWFFFHLFIFFMILKNTVISFAYFAYFIRNSIVFYHTNPTKMKKKKRKEKTFKNFPWLWSENSVLSLFYFKIWRLKTI